MRDPETVAAIFNALRQVHGDDIARVMLNDGLSLAALIDALLLAPLKNRDAVRLITRALRSSDFIVVILRRISNMFMTGQNRCTSSTWS